jgi:hypothetical protein
MNTYALPNGLVLEICEKTLVWVWAMFFAHARTNAGLSISIDKLDGRNCVRVASVYAAAYRSVLVWIDIQTGEVVSDCSEQETVRIDIDACPVRYSRGWRDEAAKLGVIAAIEATNRWEAVGV